MLGERAPSRLLRPTCRRAPASAVRPAVTASSAAKQWDEGQQRNHTNAAPGDSRRQAAAAAPPPLHRGVPPSQPEQAAGLSNAKARQAVQQHAGPQLDHKAAGPPQQQAQQPQQQGQLVQRAPTKQHQRPRQQQRPSRQQPPDAQQQQQRQQQRWLVVVEGMSDMQAVRRAAPGCDVYVLGTATAADSPRVQQELSAAAARFRGLIVLTDPDVAGRQARQALADALPGCLHSFLPSSLATAGAATRHHEEGNVGVEHAAPDAIRTALAAPRGSDLARQAFTRQQLLDWGLVADMHARGGREAHRRSLVCGHLGLGDCDGRQLLRQLNRYGFTAAEVAPA
ncbi:ribonuclease M5 [Micractinium conductrix]|uniref:Ribonuclease M5 n=1 Tax=Micractinium conductrix TaxID=554055 RepID=A0A2P6V6K3_9CHLO|nr:ribonuclease M5 [Micractinium conductrix]|eukprot:PSC69712.1 ribonuclease M5 [Micractinium conductrix]